MRRRPIDDLLTNLLNYCHQASALWALPYLISLANPDVLFLRIAGSTGRIIHTTPWERKSTPFSTKLKFFHPYGPDGFRTKFIKLCVQ